jgi:group I intron endonuclease
MVKENIGYIYKTTCLKNNKVYIGQHQTIKFNPNYLGSGDLIKRAIKKYGKEYFTVKAIYWAKTLKNLNQAEMYFIWENDSCNLKKGYNITLGGHSPMKGRKHKLETILMFKEIRKGHPVSQETKDKIGKANKGNKPFLGRKHTEESKKLMSIKAKGNKHFLGHHLSKEAKEKLSLLKKGKPGRPLSIETKNKIRDGQLKYQELKRKEKENGRKQNFFFVS